MFKIYNWQRDSQGLVLTLNMHVIGGIRDSNENLFTYWVNIADEFQVDVGTKETQDKAQTALCKFLAVNRAKVGY